MFGILIWILLGIGTGMPESPTVPFAKGIVRDANRIARRDLFGHPTFRIKRVLLVPEYPFMDATDQIPTLRYWQSKMPRKSGRRDAVLAIVRPYTNTGEHLVGGIAAGICFKGVSVANVDATKERWKSQLTVAHEIGHQLGASHSSSLIGPNWDAGCSIMSAVRCDPFDPRKNLKYNTEAQGQIDFCLNP